MSELGRTLLYLGVAVAVLLMAFVSRPRWVAEDIEARTGTTLNTVGDPLSVAKLSIIKFDEPTSTVSDFEVAEVDGIWSIPSHQDYPADAKRQMADAATSVMNLKILGVISAKPGDQKIYGVVDPAPEKLKAGAVGVGTKVIMKGPKNDTLVQMIIGKEVKDEPGQRYVREVGRDPIYVVKLDPSKLSTTFDNWIEDDLLQLNSWDIHGITLKDYSADLAMTLQGPTIMWDRRGETIVSYDDREGKWSIEEMEKFDQGKESFVAVDLAADEEVNTEVLDELKDAIDDLTIVDVERKPEGLSKDLKAAKDFADNPDATANLATRGFVPVQVGDTYEILSSDGEIRCTMKDGVEYVMRFGKIVLGADGQVGDGVEEDAEINRYLFVMAEFNQDVIEKPALEQLPPLPQEGASVENSAELSTPSPEGGGSKGEGQEEPTAVDAEKPGEAKPGQKSEAQGEDATERMAQREEIEKENRRRLDEYEEKLREGQRRVDELNARFGDWYYVISEEVFKKIHLGREELVKKKSAQPVNTEQKAAES